MQNSKIDAKGAEYAEYAEYTDWLQQSTPGSVVPLAMFETSKYQNLPIYAL